jgi:hypothetical protein
LKDSNVCRLSKALTASSDQVTSYGNRVGADATGLDRVLQGAVRELHNHGLKPAVSKLDFHIGSRSTGMPFLFPRERAAPGVEFATLDSYQRTIELDGAFGTLTVRPDEAGTQLQVRLEIPNYERLAQMVERIRRIFDLDANPIQIPSYLSADPDLRHLVKRRLGLRVPCVWDGFEAAVHAVLGQNLTKKGAGKQVA